MLKSNIIWPKRRRYKSRTEWEPVGFFSDCLCNACRFDLMLGFFSTSAISVLANGFATFLYNGGKMRLIINDILSDEDKQAIQKGITREKLPYFDLSNIQNIKEILSERDRHFFDCIAWLIRNDRIDIKIISPKTGIGISHTKAGVFYDRVNEVCFDGSCNFSKTALLENIESITISCGWDNELESEKVQAIKEDFDRIFQEKDESVTYKNVSDVKTQITKNFTDKSIEELLNNEVEIIKKQTKDTVSKSAIQALNRAKERVEAIIEKMSSQQKEELSKSEKPAFPYSSGPRDYQKDAFEKWKSNGQKGLFAMATGTGKTITSLNCLLEIYKRCNYYKAIILVPTITLVDQWEKECLKFKFSNIIKVCSHNSKWKNEVHFQHTLEAIDVDKASYIIIATYTSFCKESTFNVLNSFAKGKVLLIADEAHNMGSYSLKKKLSQITYLRRIGLSATPERQFDESGNTAIQDFFGVKDGVYTYEYSMKEAIDKGVLCKYLYFPHVIELTDEEMDEYIVISEKIAKYFNYSKECFTKIDDILAALLIKRKRIIHKAFNKKLEFKKIVEERFQEQGNLKYTLVYVPEGNKPDLDYSDHFTEIDSSIYDEESDHLIDQYTAIVRDLSERITVRKFTSESTDRDAMLKGFATGDIEVLTSMKCLDEGVDVPRSELAIFCASTGNPRQFVQRRGRILRTHPDKHMAIIHDLIVAPRVGHSSYSYNMERSLLKTEITRVNNFAMLSLNPFKAQQELMEILEYYNLNLFDN